MALWLHADHTSQADADQAPITLLRNPHPTAPMVPAVTYWMYSRGIEKRKKKLSSLPEVQDGDPLTKGFLKSTAKNIPSATSLCDRGFLPFPEHSTQLPAPEPSPWSLPRAPNLQTPAWPTPPPRIWVHLRPQRSSFHGMATERCPCLRTGHELQPRPFSQRASQPSGAAPSTVRARCHVRADRKERTYMDKKAT